MRRKGDLWKFDFPEKEDIFEIEERYQNEASSKYYERRRNCLECKCAYFPCKFAQLVIKLSKTKN